MSNGSIGKSGTQLRSNKVDPVGFEKVSFAHQASQGDTGIDMLNLNAPPDFVNRSPGQIQEALGRAAEGNLLLSNGEGKVMGEGVDFIRTGTRIEFAGGFTADEGEIFYGTIDNSPQKGRVDLLDGHQISPRNTLEVGQTAFNLGRTVRIPQGNEPDPIIVMRNRQQSLRGDDWQYVDNGSGYAQLIEFNRPGELLSGGVKEEVQVFSNGFAVEKSPTSQRREIEKIRGQVERITQALETNLGLDQILFLLGSPTQDDLLAFGDKVLDLLNRMQTQENVATEPNRIQTKIVQNDITSDGVFMSFNNLVIGKRYTIFLHYNFQVNQVNSDAAVEIRINHDGAQVGEGSHNASSNDAAGAVSSSTVVNFTATATSVDLEAVSATSDSFILGNGNKNGTYAQIEERNDQVVTNDFS